MCLSEVRVGEPRYMVSLEMGFLEKTNLGLPFLSSLKRVVHFLGMFKPFTLCEIAIGLRPRSE